MKTAELTIEQLEILKHTARNGRYVCDVGPNMVTLVARGLLCDFGPQSLAGGMHYYTLTGAGRQAIYPPIHQTNEGKV